MNLFTEEFLLRLACELEDKPVSITFRASDRLAKILKQKAEADEVSVSTCIRDLIKRALQ